MKNDEFIYFTVSTVKNIETIYHNFSIIKSLYTISKLYIVCPTDDIDAFKLKFPFFEIIDDNSLINFDEFKLYFESSFGHKNIKRLRWYYQQCLKIHFALLSNFNLPILMFDADSILISKIRFFDNQNKYSCLYGSLLEFHEPYFLPLKILFYNETFNNLYGFTNQFFTLTQLEKNQLNKAFSNYNPTNFNIKKIHNKLYIKILDLIKNSGSINYQSGFSEQELIGINNQLASHNKQILILTIRLWNNKGLLNKKMIKILKLLNFKIVTYEYTNVAYKEKMKWVHFFKVILGNIIVQFIFLLKLKFILFLKK